jgi:hypothetical protein
MRRSRFSRGVPYVMSSSDKQNFLLSLDSDPDLREDVETLLGVDLSSMSDDEKITALRSYEDANYGAAQLAQMAKARNDLHREALRKRGELEARDQLALMEEQNRVLVEKVNELQDTLEEGRKATHPTRTQRNAAKEQ